MDRFAYGRAADSIRMPVAPLRAPRINATGPVRRRRGLAEKGRTSRNGGITVAESASGQYPGAAIWVHISFDIHLVSALPPLEFVFHTQVEAIKSL